MSDHLEYLKEMQALYLFAEKQFLEFDEIVPISKNRHDVVSPKLYFLLITVCGQIESLMGQFHDKLGIGNKRDTFAALYEKFNKSNILDEQTIEVVMTRMIIRPFSKSDNTPFWWKSYNKAKHEMPDGMKQATIKNTLWALGGLYLLLNFYKSIPPINSNEILENKRWRHNTTRQSMGLNLHQNMDYGYECLFESKLFILKSHFLNSEN